MMLRAASLIPLPHCILSLSLITLLYFSNLLDSARLVIGYLVADVVKANYSEPSLDSPLELALRAATLIPLWRYYLGFAIVVFVSVYYFFETHLLHDVLTGFRGDSVCLTFHPQSKLYESVVSKCQILRGRYLATPWLCSPHLQTAFVSFFGRPPSVSYRREIFHAPDGGTIGLDWLRSSDALESAPHMNGDIVKDDKTPIVIVIPGLSSDSASAYVKHLALKIAKRGWNVCVINHRGFGGIPLTSDCIPNGGFTEDIRAVADYLHRRYPEAPRYGVGISIGANLLVKYLGEEGINAHLDGAAAICSPWDLVQLEKFLNRSLMQRVYNKVLAIALQSFAAQHPAFFSRIADWEGIKKSSSLRDFDRNATCHVAKLKTPDEYYRLSGSSRFVGSVAVPLLCINSLDDPICPKEAIPWDDCRANKNIILATTQHGGHIGYYEGITANSMWWVRAADEFLGAVHSSRFILRKKEMRVFPLPSSQESCIGWNPYFNVMEAEKMKAKGNKATNVPVKCSTDVPLAQDEE